MPYPPLFRTLILLILGASSLALFAWQLPSGFGQFWADSEIWAVTTSRWLLDRPSDFSFGMKPLFHAALYVLSLRHDLSGTNPRALAGLLDDARAMMVLNSTWLFFVLLVLGRRLTSSWIPGAFAILGLLLSDFFVGQMWQIRSDLFATPWILLALVFLFESAPRRALACALVAFWLTPKSGLVLLAFLPLLHLHGLARFTRNGLMATLGGVALLLVLQGEALLQALGHFWNETRAEQMGMSMLDPIRWRYVAEAGATDPWFWLASAAGLASLPWLSRGHRALASFGIFTALSALILALNPSKLPFLIASFQPFFALAAASALFAGLTMAPMARRRHLLATVAVAFLAATTAMGVWSKKDRGRDQTSHGDNRAQRFLLEEWNLYLMDFPRVNAYDGLGLALRPRLSSYFVGPGQLEKNRGLVDHLRDEDYLLIAQTQKVSLVENELRGLFEERYRPSPGGLWRRALRLEDFATGTLVPLRTLAPAIRRVFALVLEPSILVRLEDANGEPVASAVEFVSEDGAVVHTETFPLPWARLLEDERLSLRFTTTEGLALTPFKNFGSATGLGFFELFRFRPLAGAEPFAPQGDN